MNHTQAVLCKIINQLFNIENKVNQSSPSNQMTRRFDRIKDYIQELDLVIHDPIHEDYNETRTDCEATVAGDKISNLKIVEVIKPIIYHQIEGSQQIIQRGVVIVEGR